VSRPTCRIKHSSTHPSASLHQCTGLGMREPAGHERVKKLSPHEIEVSDYCVTIKTVEHTNHTKHEVKIRRGELHFITRLRRDNPRNNDPSSGGCLQGEHVLARRHQLRVAASRAERHAQLVRFVVRDVQFGSGLCDTKAMKSCATRVRYIIVDGEGKFSMLLTQPAHLS